MELTMPDDDYDEHDDHDQQYDDEEENKPSHQIAVKKTPKLPALFEDLGFGRVTTKDKLSFTYNDGTLKATVKRPSGVSQTTVRNVKAGFKSMTEFDPNEMASRSERNGHIRRMYKQGLSQQQLAEQFGLSQSMINRIVNSSD